MKDDVIFEIAMTKENRIKGLAVCIAILIILLQIMNNTENPYKNLDMDKLDKVLKDVTKDWDKKMPKLYLFDTMLTEDYKNKIKEVINKGNDYP